MSNDRPIVLGLFCIAGALVLNWLVNQPVPRDSGTWVAIFTFMLFTSTTGLGVATYALWRVTRQSLLDTRLNNERSLRAYVCMVRARLEGFRLGEIPSVMITLENSGQTPAYGLHGARDIDIREYPLTSELRAFDEGADWPKIILGPRSEHMPTISYDRHINAEDLIEVKRGRRALYVWGFVRYTDAFGQTRSSEYCLYYIGDESQNPVGMLAYPAGNNAT